MPKEYRTIQEVAGPLMLVHGVENVAYDELGEIELADGEIRRCKVLEINGEDALVQLFENSTGINLSNSKVRFLGRSMELGVSEDMLGRVFDGLGRPIDGGPEILPDERRDINGLPMNPAARNYPSEFIQTGISAIDGLNTLVRGQKLLGEADIIIYAGSLVNPALLDLKKEGCVVYNSATMTLEQVIDVMKEAESKGQTVARLHTGDPCLYGAIREQIDALDALGIAHDDCPGVSSFCGAAAALEMEYTLPDISQSVVITRMAGRTPVPERESIASFAAHQATMVVFLSTGLLEELSRELIAGGYTADTPAAIVYKATWPEEKTFVCTVGTLAETAKKNQITKTALMIIGNAVSQGNYRRSDLYNPAFTTEFREAEK